MDKKVGKGVKKVLLGAVISVFLMVCARGVFAEGERGHADAKAPGRDKGGFSERKTELLKLKQENPEKFKEAMQEKRASIKERLKHLKETDPERYQALTQRIREKKLDRLQKLRKENPEEFKRLVEARKEKFQERLKVLKEKDPKEYQKIMALKQELPKLKEMRRNNPEEFKAYLEKHPKLKEHLERRMHQGPSKERGRGNGER
jgi:hypothetical protein